MSEEFAASICTEQLEVVITKQRGAFPLVLSDIQRERAISNGCALQRGKRNRSDFLTYARCWAR